MLVEQTIDVSLSNQPQVIVGSNSVAIWLDGHCLSQWLEEEQTQQPALVYEMADIIRLALTDSQRLLAILRNR